MPQVDLGPIFTPPSSPKQSPESGGDPLDVDRAPPKNIGSKRRLLSNAQWTNLAFVLCACFGALFSMVYLFKGELVQEVAAWPRELFRGRAIASSQPNPGRSQTVSRNDDAVSRAQEADSGDPFSSVSSSLKLDRFSQMPDRPNRMATSPFSRPTAVFNSLSGSSADTAGSTLAANAPASESTAPSVSNIGSAIAAPGQTSIASASAPQQAKTTSTAAKTATMRAANTTSRGAKRIASRSTKVSRATHTMKMAKTSWFKSLFRMNSQRAAKGNSKTASIRRKSAVAHAAKTTKQANRSNIAYASRTTNRVKTTSAKASLGKTSGQTATVGKAAKGQSSRQSAVVLRSGSSRIPQVSRSSASPAIRSATPSGISGSAGGTSSFGRPFGSISGAMAPARMGGGFGAHGFGRAGGR